MRICGQIKLSDASSYGDEVTMDDRTCTGRPPAQEEPGDLVKPLSSQPKDSLRKCQGRMHPCADAGAYTPPSIGVESLLMLMIGCINDLP